MGWLGWTEPQALATDVNSIMIAMEGKLEMMYPECRAAPKNSASERFKDFAKGHNARLANKR